MSSLAEIMAQTKFNEYYKRPEWNAFATDVRRKSGNACQSCKRSDVQTQLHHIFYEPGKKPWEYDRADMVLLCTPCHKELHRELQNFRRYVFGKMNGQVLRVINGALAVALEQYHPLVFAHALAEFVSNPRLVERHAAAWNAPEPKKPEPSTPKSPTTRKNL